MSFGTFLVKYHFSHTKILLTLTVEGKEVVKHYCISLSRNTAMRGDCQAFFPTLREKIYKYIYITGGSISLFIPGLCLPYMNINMTGCN